MLQTHFIKNSFYPSKVFDSKIPDFNGNSIEKLEFRHRSLAGYSMKHPNSKTTTNHKPNSKVRLKKGRNQ